MDRRKGGGGGGSLNGDIDHESGHHHTDFDSEEQKSPDIQDDNNCEDHELMEHSTKIPDSSQTLPRNGFRGKDRNRTSGRLRKAGTIADIRERVEYAKDLVQHDTHYRIHFITVLLILLLGGLLIFVSTKLFILYLASREPICMTSECLSSSARILNNFNSTLEPCNNFYRFACDGWKRKHELGIAQAEYSVEDEINDRLYDDLRRYLDQVLSSGSANDAHIKAKRFYKSCMELDNIDYFSLHNFRHEIQAAGGWSVNGEWNAMNWDRSQALEKLHTVYGVHPFFKVDVGPDDLDPQLPFIIKIFPSGLGLPSRDYYFNPKYESVVNAYKNFMSETVKIFGGTSLDASQFASNTFSYEKRIAEITPSYDDYLHPSLMFRRRYSIRELKVFAPSIKWERVLQSYFEKARLNENTRVLLAFEPYFKNISNLISTTDSQGLNDYMMWRFIMTYSPYLSKDFRINYKNFQNSLHGLPPTNFLDDEYRWKFCIESTSKFMGFALSSLYINNRIAEISNATVASKADIVGTIRETLLKNRAFFFWNPNDEEQATKFINLKLKSMDVLVGQPQFVLQNNVAEYYNEFMVNIKFLMNIMESVNHRHKKMERLLSSKQPDFTWPIYPHDTKPAYNYAGNRLYIPFGLLQLPFYSSSELRVMQFGGLGFHVAAEMLRAFDLIGAYYGIPDGRLNAKQFFYEDSAFFSELRCMNWQLKDFDPELNLNRTLQQTYIDDGALRLAYSAYREFARRRSEAFQTLPSLRFTSDQLFYLSFAQSMCSNTRRTTVDYKIQTEHRLPAEQRVNFLLTQNRHFRDTFNCPRKQTGNYQTQCHLWN